VAVIASQRKLSLKRPADESQIMSPSVRAPLAVGGAGDWISGGGGGAAVCTHTHTHAHQ
jgi:hypothetical protein